MSLLVSLAGGSVCLHFSSSYPERGRGDGCGRAIGGTPQGRPGRPMRCTSALGCECRTRTTAPCTIGAFGPPQARSCFSWVARSGQLSEEGSRRSVDWQPLSDPAHHGIRRWIIDLNRQYASEPALHELDFEAAAFSWVDANEWDQSVVSIMRSSSGGRHVLGVFKFTSMPRPGYRACPRVGSGASCSPATPSSRAARAAAAGLPLAPLLGYLTAPPLGAVFLSPAMPTPAS